MNKNIFTAHDIFISYRHQDYDIAVLTEAYLGQLGYDVFWDINLKNEDLPNEEFPPVLDYNVANCKDFILIITENTFSKDRIFDPKDWIYREVEMALRTGRHIVAFMVNNASLPNEEDLPPALRPLKTDKEIYHFPIELKIREKEEIYHDLNRRLKSTPTFATRQGEIGGENYDAKEEKERERLRLQAGNTYDFDMKILNQILENDERSSFVVLDVGCAQGFVGATRFESDKFTAVLGIDKNKECITYARCENRPMKFRYEQVDLASDNFENDLKYALGCIGQKKVDIIFASLTLHFLKDPLGCILKMRQFLNPNGYIIVRGSSDETKIANTDEDTELIRRIIKRTYAIEGIADRKNGSKIYNWLVNSGFDDVKIYSAMRDTSGMRPSEKIKLFKESFAWRLDVLASDEKNANTSRYKGLKKDLETLERRFYDPSFWYCEYDYIGIGKF